MAEYIEREAVMQMFADRVKRSNNSDFAPTPTWNQAVQIVEDAPAADVVPVRHGRWVSVFDVGTVCNQCGYDIEQHGFDVRTDGEPNYCPNCGALMDKDGDGDV